MAGHKIIVNVGCQGTAYAGGFNGGGGITPLSGQGGKCGNAGGGGGASDIRTGVSFSTVILMAGGGAGYGYGGPRAGSYGGDKTLLTSTQLTGGTGTYVNSNCGSGGGGGYLGGQGGAGMVGGGGSSYIGPKKNLAGPTELAGVWGGGNGMIILTY